ncbi:MAG: nickel-responsive transcriptional regulator NikR [bacterium]
MKPTPTKKNQAGVARISVSLPRDLSIELDALVAARGFESRSQALNSMIAESLVEHRKDDGDAVMAGTITLFFSQKKNNILTDLADLKRKHLDEVIGSLQVQLEDNHIMEVILVQGPAGVLRKISDAFATCKGVKVGKLTLTSTIIPQLHPLKK